MQFLENIVIVLHETSHPGNIGSVARAMKNMGLTQLVLVNPKQFPHPKATALASGAEDLLESARVVDNLVEGLADCELAIASSARLRSKNWPLLSPRQAGADAVQYAQTQGKVAFLFGNEQAGLSNEELAYCKYQTHIPTVAHFKSLNLAQAVQVLAYEVYMAAIDTDQPPHQPSAKLASAKEIDLLHEHIMAFVKQIGFYQPKKSSTLSMKLRRLFARFRLEHEEVQILRGVLRASQKKMSADEC